MLKELRDFVDDGRERLQDRQERWDDRLRTRASRCATPSTNSRELEEHLANYHFGR